MEAIDYEKLAEAIAVKLRKTPGIEEAIWDSDDCAEYLKFSRRHFIDKVSKHHTFPTPCRSLTWAASVVHLDG